MEKGTAYIKHDALIRRMCSEGASLTQMSNILHAHRSDIRLYIEKHNIPHDPFVKSRPLNKNGRWTGGRIVDEDGYILIKKLDHPNCDRHGYVREHRLVMEQKLGRYLDRREVVHHIDGNKQNNSIDNLELFSKNGDHLAKTLKGKIPKWSEDGKRRILLGTRRPKPRR